MHSVFPPHIFSPRMHAHVSFSAEQKLANFQLRLLFFFIPSSIRHIFLIYCTAAFPPLFITEGIASFKLDGEAAKVGWSTQVFTPGSGAPIKIGMTVNAKEYMQAR